MNEVTLKNGSTEMEVLVTSTMMHLNMLMKELTGALAAHDLVGVCQCRDFRPFGNNAEILKARGLMHSDGSVHQSIKNIVLSAFVSEGEYDFHFESPIVVEQ